VGHVAIDVELAWAKRERLRILVDKGATYTVLPSDLARRLGIVEGPRRIKVRLADGRQKSMRVGTVIVRVLGREAASTVLIGPRGIEPLLGAEALEALGLAVDPTSRRLRG
jgi:clan AA aspartic protease